MTTSRTQWGPLDEQAMALLALPANPCSRLPPYASDLIFHIGLAVGYDISRIAIGKFARFGGLSGALGAARMATLRACRSGRRDEQGLALVAGAAHTLPNRLVDAVLSVLVSHGQDFLLSLARLLSLWLFTLLTGLFLEWEAGALLAALVLAFDAGSLGAKGGTAMVAGAVDSHANGLLNALDVDGLGGSRDPFVGLEGKVVLGEQRAGTLMLQSDAGDLLGDGLRGGSRGSGCRCRSSSGRTGDRLAKQVEVFLPYRTHVAVVVASLFSKTGAGVEGAAGLEGVSTLLDDFSRLKTLLMRFTYLPKLLRRSASLCSGGLEPPGVDMMAVVSVEVCSWCRCAGWGFAD